jgi:YVTN family beta-propeller protein
MIININKRSKMMKIGIKIHSTTLASAAIILFLILFSSAAVAQEESAKTYTYTVSPDGNTVSIIDKQTAKVTATVNIESNGGGIAVSPDGSKLYVSQEGDGIKSIISVFDTATNTLTAIVNVPYPVGGYYTLRLAITPDGTTLFETNGYDTVSVIDTSTNQVVKQVHLVDNPVGIAVSPDGKEVYIALSDYAKIYRMSAVTYMGEGYIDMDTLIPGSEGFWDVVVSPDSKKIYATDSYKGTVYIYNTDPTTTIANFNVGESGNRVTVSLDGNQVYATDRNGVTVGTIDIKTDKLLDTTNIPEYPSIVLPVAVILCLVTFFGRKKVKNNVW